MDNQIIVLKTSFKGLIGEFVKKLSIVLLMIVLLVAANMFKSYLANRYNISGSIFKGDILGTVSMIIMYIVLGIFIILLLIALYKLLILFYELKRVTTINFANHKIIIEKYEFPFTKEVLEKKFNCLVGVEVFQKFVDRNVDSGCLYVEYLVESKIDSKLRGIELPYVLYPLKIKDKLMECN